MDVLLALGEYSLNQELLSGADVYFQEAQRLISELGQKSSLRYFRLAVKQVEIKISQKNQNLVEDIDKVLKEMDNYKRFEDLMEQNQLQEEQLELIQLISQLYIY